MITIAKTALKRKKNTLILFTQIKYGKNFFDILKKYSKEKEVYYIDGKVKGKERERIRLLAEERDNVIIVASFRTFSTGIDIKNLHHIMFLESIQSFTKILQSIGRGLRLYKDKKAILWDFVDDLSSQAKKSKVIRKNYVLKHALKRISIYNKENFEYEIKEFKL